MKRFERKERMTKNEKKVLLQGFAALVIIVIISLFCGTAKGAEAASSFKVVSLNGVEYSGRITESGRFKVVWIDGGPEISRSARYDTYYGYCFRSNYQDARLEILRAILPESTQEIGTLRRQCGNYENKIENIDKQLETERNAATIKALKEERQSCREKIRNREAKIYNLLPELLKQVKAGNLEPELRNNNSDSTFAAKILQGGIDSVQKNKSKYVPSYNADSADF